MRTVAVLFWCLVLFIGVLFLSGTTLFPFSSSLFFRFLIFFFFFVSVVTIAVVFCLLFFFSQHQLQVGFTVCLGMYYPLFSKPLGPGSF